MTARCLPRAALPELAACAFLLGAVDDALAAPRVLAVLELVPRDKATTTTNAGLLGDVVRGAAAEALRGTGFTVISRDIIDQTLAELEKRGAACDLGSCDAEIAGNLGASHFITGDIIRLGKSLVVTLKLSRQSDNALLASRQVRGADVEALFDGLAAPTREVVQVLVSALPDKVTGAVAPGTAGAVPQGAAVPAAVTPVVPPPTCTDGRIAVGGHCCWPGQAWTESALRCTGTPTCPEGRTARGEACVVSQEVAQKGTDLVWLRCPVGQEWDGKTCTGEATKLNLDGAKSACPAGYRLPTVEEYRPLLQKNIPCAGTPTCAALFGADVGDYWTGTTKKKLFLTFGRWVSLEVGDDWEIGGKAENKVRCVRTRER